MSSPTLLDYAYLANAVYSIDDHAVIDYLVKQRRSEWAVRLWRAGTASNGFQGAILESDSDVVCAYKGTQLGGATARQDLMNDLTLAINLIPTQAMAAAEMVVAARSIAGRKPHSLVGHSLGGVLAQLIGYFSGLPFVTFNAPGMLGNVELVPFLYRGTSPGGPIQGFNMILLTDWIGNYGRHIGKTERFMTPGALNPWGGRAFMAHMMANVLLVLESKAAWAAKVLAALI
jgi:hypothetical protein